MDPTYGFLSLIPPLLAIGLALITRRVYLALAAGIGLGYIMMAGGHPLDGMLGAIDGLVTVLSSPGNARLVSFTLLMGALIALIQTSGGVQGFINHILAFLDRIKANQTVRGRRKIVEIITTFTGLILFIESNISILTVGTLYRPIFDKLKIPREKLAYITDSTCAPSCILMPFNAWGAFIMGLLLAQGVSEPFSVLMGSIIYNAYPILTILLVFIIILSGKDVGDMARAEERAQLTGRVLREGAKPMVDDSLTMLGPKKDVVLRARNMVIPIAVMIISMPLFLAYTGWGAVEGAGLSRAMAALSKGSGSASVLYAVSFAVLTAMILYKAQGLLGVRDMIDLSLKGMSGMVGITVLTLLAFALNDMCKQLGTGLYLAQTAEGLITPAWVPVIIFLISGLMAFSTGTSWGTFAIMIAVAVPLAQNMGVNLHLAIAAALGGGIFGDHCSPTSDTTVITSMATANDHIDHVRTQLPYALLAGGLTVVIYLILGVVSAA